MRTPLIATLCVTLLVSGCGGFRDSRLNPLNWFGRSERVTPAVVAVPAEAEDARPLVQDVLSMSVEPVPTGAIVRATGRTPTQGWWEAELVEREDTEDPGVIVYDFRLLPPVVPTDVNTPQSREVTVGIYLSNIKLQDVRQIVVQGASGARSSRR